MLLYTFIDLAFSTGVLNIEMHSSDDIFMTPFDYKHFINF